MPSCETTKLRGEEVPLQLAMAKAVGPVEYFDSVLGTSVDPARPGEKGMPMTLERCASPSSFVLAFLLFLVPMGGLLAQAHGRINLTVEDEKGKPVEGVHIKVTSPESSAFERELVTDKKGRAKLLVNDATKSYRFKIELEGYHPIDHTIKVQVNETHRETLELQPRAEAKKLKPVSTQGRVSKTGKAFNEGLTALRAGDLDVAEQKLLEVLERESDMAPAHQALARLYLQRKDYSSTLASAQRLLEIEPDNAQGWRALYEAQVGLGNDEEADKALAALAGLDQGGDAPALLYNEGVRALQSGDSSTAKAKFLDALELQSDLVPAMVALTRIYLAEDNAQEAVKSVEAAIALEGDQIDALALRYEAYRRLGDAEKTQAAFDDFAGADPQRVAQLLLEGGVGMFNAGDAAGARDQLERALELNPDLPKALYSLGLSYLSLGESDKARASLERFLELAPDDPDAPGAKEMLGFLQ